MDFQVSPAQSKQRNTETHKNVLPMNVDRQSS